MLPYNPYIHKYLTVYIGQVVSHYEYGYRGVVVGWEINPVTDTQDVHILIDTHDYYEFTPVKEYKKGQNSDSSSSTSTSSATSDTSTSTTGTGYSFPSNPPPSNLKDIDKIRILPHYELNIITDKHLMRIINDTLYTYFIGYDNNIHRYIPIKTLSYCYPHDFNVYNMYIYTNSESSLLQHKNSGYSKKQYNNNYNTVYGTSRNFEKKSNIDLEISHNNINNTIIQYIDHLISIILSYNIPPIRSQLPLQKSTHTPVPDYPSPLPDTQNSVFFTSPDSTPAVDSNNMLYEYINTEQYGILHDLLIALEDVKSNIIEPVSIITPSYLSLSQYQLWNGETLRINHENTTSLTDLNAPNTTYNTTSSRSSKTVSKTLYAAAESISDPILNTTSNTTSSSTNQQPSTGTPKRTYTIQSLSIYNNRYQRRHETYRAIDKLCHIYHSLDKMLYQRLQVVLTQLTPNPDLTCT